MSVSPPRTCAGEEANGHPAPAGLQSWVPAGVGELEMKAKQWCKGPVRDTPMAASEESRVLAAEGEPFTVFAV